MNVAAAGFDWGDGNRRKCQKHGVTIIEIEGLFRRPFSVLPDSAHSKKEERLKAIGITPSGRRVLIVFTLHVHRDVALVRPISAWYMHRKEVAHYEEQTAKAEKTSDS